MRASEEINSTVQEMGIFIHVMALPGTPRRDSIPELSCTQETAALIFSKHYRIRFCFMAPKNPVAYSQSSKNQLSYEITIIQTTFLHVLYCNSILTARKKNLYKLQLSNTGLSSSEISLQPLKKKLKEEHKQTNTLMAVGCQVTGRATLVGHALAEDWDTWEPDRKFRRKEFALVHPISTDTLLWPKPELSCVIYHTRSQLSTWPGITAAYSTNALSQLLGLMYNSLFFNEISVHETC
ncbi:hypothetical protein AV530_012701 [Patagioenas fasciata monilis]|uniref:Uncharacterized protein n=1 Tax=Patagioenas fasciata monilis TaxID=372326 RepID=A0A1V4JC05_PATFA|nr:hypothetical protein AV530_012701 [Patagioenas fasciata monilis]